MSASDSQAGNGLGSGKRVSRRSPFSPQPSSAHEEPAAEKIGDAKRLQYPRRTQLRIPEAMNLDNYGVLNGAQGRNRTTDTVIFSDDQSCCRLLQPATSRILKCLELLLHCAKLVATRLNTPHSTTRVFVTHMSPSGVVRQYAARRLIQQSLAWVSRSTPPYEYGPLGFPVPTTIHDV
jgi:hypothetical protein